MLWDSDVKVTGVSVELKNSARSMQQEAVLCFEISQAYIQISRRVYEAVCAHRQYMRSIQKCDTSNKRA